MSNTLGDASEQPWSGSQSTESGLATVAAYYGLDPQEIISLPRGVALELVGLAAQRHNLVSNAERLGIVGAEDLPFEKLQEVVHRAIAAAEQR